MQDNTVDTTDLSAVCGTVQTALRVLVAAFGMLGETGTIETAETVAKFIRMSDEGLTIILPNVDAATVYNAVDQAKDGAFQPAEIDVWPTNTYKITGGYVYYCDGTSSPIVYGDRDIYLTPDQIDNEADAQSRFNDTTGRPVWFTEIRTRSQNNTSGSMNKNYLDRERNKERCTECGKVNYSLLYTVADNPGRFCYDCKDKFNAAHNRVEGAKG